MPVLSGYIPCVMVFVNLLLQKFLPGRYVNHACLEKFENFPLKSLSKYYYYYFFIVVLVVHAFI